jgi:DNA invertase Pin-like site-specific DNA recombinase
MSSEVGNSLVSHVIVPDCACLSRNLHDIHIIFIEFNNHGVELAVCI